MKWDTRLVIMLFATIFFVGCAYNPFSANNHLTGSPVSTGIGAGIAAGSIALLGGSKTLMVLGGLGGGAVGYYVSTLRYDAGGIIEGGGQVYVQGEFIGINIPSDRLFELNTADLLPQSGPILDSVVTVLSRFPNNNILISGNTSGFSRSRWELRMSEARARRVASYLWDAGIRNNSRKLTYVGYGDYFPIANHIYNSGIRANSRIQITSYPSNLNIPVARETGSSLSDAFSSAGIQCVGYRGC